MAEKYVNDRSEDEGASSLPDNATDIVQGLSKIHFNVDCYFNVENAGTQSLCSA